MTGRVKVVETNIQPNTPLETRRATNFLVIHHIGEIPASMTRDQIDAFVIDQWHKQKGWSMCGYHYVVLTNGTIQRGRPRTALGSHVQEHNWETIGINVVGDFTKQTPTPAQMTSLVGLLADLKDIYGLSVDRIVGHKDLNPPPITECPGEIMYNQIDYIKKLVASA